MSPLAKYCESFDAFADEPASAFYAAPGSSPEDTNREIVSSMDGALRHVVSLHQSGSHIPLTTAALREWHHRIFVTTFPADAGRPRWKTATGTWETVTFGINVGTTRTRRVLSRQGAPPRQISRRLDRIFGRYSDELERASTDGITLQEATLSVAHVYAKTLSVHPFVDGNLRASFVALQAALLNYGLPLVIFKDLAAHDDHLDRALRPGGRKQDYQPLAGHLAEIIRAARPG